MTSPSAGATRFRFDGFALSPRKEAPQHHQATMGATRRPCQSVAPERAAKSGSLRLRLWHAGVMLREAIDWLVTPALPLARRSGHLGEFVAIAARRRRQRKVWAAHDARSRAAVLRAAGDGDPARTALILGAGHVNDVPLAELAARFKTVELVDLAFSWRTRRLARRLGNVVCRPHDVTESLPILPEVREPTAWLDRDDLGFVASVNLISQLSTVATRELEDAEADPIGKAMAEAHLRWLSRFRCPACLIGDRLIEVLNESGAPVATIDPTKGADLPAHDEEWVWDIAPRGEIDRRYSVRHRVVAIDRVNR